jgi:hypothetical protein
LIRTSTTIKLSIFGVTLWMLTTSAVELVLFEDEVCDNFEPDNYTHACFGYDYD